MARLFSLWIAVGSAALWAAGCASTPDPPPPDLSSEIQAAQSRIQSLDRAEEIISDDLAQVERLRDDHHAIIDRIADLPLPLSLLRLVAMNCLNAEYHPSPEVIDLNGTPLSCHPAHIDELQRALGEAPTPARDEAYRLLYLVDQARLLRGSLRQRIARLPQDTAAYRDFIADERASIRRIDADLVRSRNQYSTDGWRDATAVLDEYRALLHRLDSRIDAIIESYPEWPARLDRAISEIYFDLTDLRANQWK